MEVDASASPDTLPPIDGAPGRTWAWRRLLRASAIVSIVLMVIGIVILGPFPPFIVMAVLTLVGVVLTRWKTRIGAVVIAVPSVALLVVFAGSSAIFVVTHPIAFVDVFGGLISVLAIALLVNSVAAVATLAEGVVPTLRSRRASAIVGALAVLVVIVVGTLGGAARLGFTNSTAAAGDSRIEMKSDTTYSPQTLDSTQETNIYITNTDGTVHTFTIDGVVNQAVPANSSAKVSVKLQPGTYQYYCAVPGHRDTMHGTLTVH
jgi:plastocyanin